LFKKPKERTEKICSRGKGEILCCRSQFNARFARQRRALPFSSHRPASLISNFRSAASTLGKWNRTHRALIRIEGIIFRATKLSIERCETLIACASCGRFNNAKSFVAASGTNTLGVRAAWRVLLVVFCVVMVVPFYL
jgi:hypothetical protein